MQAHLARSLFFAMALDAVLDKDRLNLRLEIDFVLGVSS
jgi:hypothetical protein